MTLPFVKYHGAGNDFILIDDRGKDFPVDSPHSVRRLCDRRYGIGADGVILVQTSRNADIRMRIFNADGSEPTMCGNGIRCLVHFLRHLGLTAREWRVETGHGVLFCRWIGEKIGVHLGTPQLLHRDLQLSVLQQGAPLHVLHTGVPHGVIFVTDVAAVDLDTLGRGLSVHPLFSPEGINVNLATVSSEGEIVMRTYERGVGETLACGTGAAAVAWVARELFSLPETVSIRTRTQEEMQVHFLRSEIELVGTATPVFQGTLERAWLS